VKIFWTKRAQDSFDKTVGFINEKWSLSSAIKFVRKANQFLKIIENQPYIGRPEKAGKDLRSFVISRQTTVFYRAKADKIIILKFFDTRQNPKKRLR